MVTLHHGDALQLLPDLCPTPAVIITDPPYGTGADGYLSGPHRIGKAPPGHEWVKKTIANDLDTTARDTILAMYPDTPAYVFGALHKPPPPGTVQTLIYRKAPGAGAVSARGGWRRDLEAVHMVGPWPIGAPIRSGLLTTATRSQGSPYGVGGVNGHPHAKPIDVLAALIAASPEGVILDPFAGSGTTLIAAHLAGREAVGIEVDADHHANARRNMARYGITTEGPPIPVQCTID